MNDLKKPKKKYLNFILSLNKNGDFKFTKNSQICSFSLCFAIFGLNLLNQKSYIEKNKIEWNKKIKNNLVDYYNKRKILSDNIYSDKSFLQLLCFSLSAFKILGTLNENDFLHDFFDELYNLDLINILKKNKTFIGYPRTGNLAMFYAIIIFYLINYKDYPQSSFQNYWYKEHHNSKNIYGFWGNTQNLTYLDFQNGYHQYEILKFFNYESIEINKIIKNIINFADFQGHFAPYIGGGGCYDYDAINLITSKPLDQKKLINQNIIEIIVKTHNAILLNQNIDGGFCESKYVRPINLNYFIYFFKKITNNKAIDKKTIFRQFLTLMRPKYNSITTHWNNYNRKWDESNLWDSWFRMQTLARIEIYSDYKKFDDWGFIDFPGIGFHEYLKK